MKTLVLILSLLVAGPGLINGASLERSGDDITTEGQNFTTLLRHAVKRLAGIREPVTTDTKQSQDALVAEYQSRWGVVVGQQFPSPDGRFILQLAVKDDECVYEIWDRENGSVDNSIQVPSILEGVSWLGNSRSIIGVLHMMGGSFIQTLHFDGTRWVTRDYNNPIRGVEYYMILKLHAGYNTALVTFRGYRDGCTRRSRVYFYITCLIDPSSGTQSLIEEMQICWHRFISLKSEYQKE